MAELINEYIKRFGGIPWAFNSFDDERIEREIRKALESGIPFSEEEYDEEVLY